MELLNEFIEIQLGCWELARNNYLALGKTERRRMQLGDFSCFLQYNPARERSTGAKTDADSIRKRPCFLCHVNRPKEQIAGKAAEGWELLVNPYPIFPVHFTLPSLAHEPQERFPLEIAGIAEKFPGMAVFFNGARAGASAPDHAHMQMVLASELPIVKLTEEWHRSRRSEIVGSDSFGKDLPFRWLSAVIAPDREGMRVLAALREVCGVDAETGMEDRGLVNVIFWIEEESRLLRSIVIPRKRHRPACFYADDDDRRMVSPGTIDMAGVIVLPRREDFDRLTEDELAEIYRQV